LRRLFSFFAVKNADKERMRVEEFIFMLKSIKIVNTVEEMRDASTIVIASFSFVGLTNTDLMTMKDFVSALICVGEAASFDGIIEREKRLLNFFEHELLKKANKFCSFLI
jgi:hypothetical protein